MKPAAVVLTRLILDTYSGTVADFTVAERSIVMRYQPSPTDDKDAPDPVNTPVVDNANGPQYLP